MKLFFAILTLVITLPAMAQHRPPNWPPHQPFPPHIPFPPYNPFPPTNPFPPEQQCFGERYDRALAATEAAATDKMDRFASEKGVACSLTDVDLDLAKARCVEADGSLYATLKMAFNVDCYSRDVSSRLRKTWIKYY
jgi:hypothetical protein